MQKSSLVVNMLKNVCKFNNCHETSYKGVSEQGPLNSKSFSTLKVAISICCATMSDGVVQLVQTLDN